MTGINPEVVTQTEKTVDSETTKINEGFFLKILSLISTNPN